MIYLITAGPLLALAFGVAIYTDLRDRKSRLGRVRGDRVDAKQGEAFININPPVLRSPSEYFGPPDDGRPRH